MYLHDAASLPTVTNMGFELAPGFHYMVDIETSTVYDTYNIWITKFQIALYG